MPGSLNEKAAEPETSQLVCPSPVYSPTEGTKDFCYNDSNSITSVHSRVRPSRDERRVYSEIPTANPILPGFNEFAAQRASEIAGRKATKSLKFLYQQDVIQRRARLLKQYLHLSDAINSPHSLDWDIISTELQGYSDAMKRWSSFEQEAHSSTMAGLVSKSAEDQVAARSYAAEVYEHRFADQIPDMDAAREALRMERSTMANKLCASYWQGGYFSLSPAEMKAREDADTVEREKRERQEERQREMFRAFWARFWMALFGGVSLVVPMVIMSLHSTKTTSLATTAVFTFFVAMLLAWFMKTADGKDVIAATAAYAAVLVVFVGTATQPLAKSGGGNDHQSHSDGGSGLSGGAIAGIVIGVLVGILIMLVFCAMCCFKALVDGLLAIFGLGRRGRRRDTEEEVYDGSSYYSDYTRSASASQAHGSRSSIQPRTPQGNAETRQPDPEQQ